MHKVNPNYDYISGIQNTFKNLNYGLFDMKDIYGVDGNSPMASAINEIK